MERGGAPRGSAWLSALHSGLPEGNVQRLRGGLVFKAHRLFVSLNSRLESNKEKEEEHKHHVNLRTVGPTLDLTVVNQKLTRQDNVQDPVHSAIS